MEDIILVTGRDLARSSTNVVFSESQGSEQVSLAVRVGTGSSFNDNVEWLFSREDVQGVALNRGPSGQVVPHVFSCQDGTWLNIIVSAFAPRSVHIHQGVPCHPISEDITTKASRSSRAKSGSR